MLAVVPWDTFVARVAPFAPAGPRDARRTRSCCSCGSTSCSSGSRSLMRRPVRPCTTSRCTVHSRALTPAPPASRMPRPSCASATSSSATTWPPHSSRRSTRCSGRVPLWSARARWSMRRSTVHLTRRRTGRGRVLHRPPDVEGEPVVLRPEGAHRCRRGLGPRPLGGGDAGQRARPGGGRFAAAWPGGGGPRGLGIPGHRPLVRHPRRGVDGGHATGQASVAGAGVGRGDGGAGQGLGPREGRAPFPGHQAAVRSHEGAVPVAGEERVAPGDAVCALEPLDGTAHPAGKVPPRARMRTGQHAHGPRRPSGGRFRGENGAGGAPRATIAGNVPRTGGESWLVQPFTRH